MASPTSVLLAYLLTACLLGGQIVSVCGEGLVAPEDPVTGFGSPSSYNMVHLLRMSIKEIYSRSAQALRQELAHSLAVVDAAIQGDVGPVKRNSAGPGTTSLGSGPLYFLTRGLEQQQPPADFEATVARNERMFDIAGK